jgi:hypothetical protein
MSGTIRNLGDPERSSVSIPTGDSQVVKMGGTTAAGSTVGHGRVVDAHEIPVAIFTAVSIVIH